MKRTLLLMPIVNVIGTRIKVREESKEGIKVTDTYERLLQLLEETTRRNEEEERRRVAKRWEAWKKGYLVNEMEDLDRELHLIYVARTWEDWHEQMGKFKAKSIRFHCKSVLLF
jgi:hypothetical protein